MNDIGNAGEYTKPSKSMVKKGFSMTQENLENIGYNAGRNMQGIILEPDYANKVIGQVFSKRNEITPQIHIRKFEEHIT